MKLESIRVGMKGALFILQLAFFLNPILVTGVDYDDDVNESENRVPTYNRYLSQRVYVAQPNGEYEEVAKYPEVNSTKFPSPSGDPGTLNNYVVQAQRQTGNVRNDDPETSQSITSHRFENAYTKYSYGVTDERSDQGQGSNVGSESNNNGPSSIQDILHHKQGSYTVPIKTGRAPSYEAVTYHVPGYEAPSHYFPSSGFDWPATYGVSNEAEFPVGPFLSSVGQVTSSVKQIKAEIGNQKAKTAYQFGDIIKNTGDSLNNAILSKGNAAAAVVGQTVHTASEVLRNKGATATRFIHNKGQLASNAIQTAGQVGSSFLKSKGELVGAAIKSGAAIGTSVLGTASNALAGGTQLVKVKGDAASNIIAKGGQLASGVIGTKGKLISSVITAKGNFATNIIAAKGRAAANLLETGSQKLTQLAEAIKSATAPKKAPEPEVPLGWSEPDPIYAGVPQVKQISEEEPQLAEIDQEEPQRPSYQQHNGFSQDYHDIYYEPRDNYRSDVSSNHAAATAEKIHDKRTRHNNLVQEVDNSRVPVGAIRQNNHQQQQQQQQRQQQPQKSQFHREKVNQYRTEEDDDLFQNDYSSYYPYSGSGYPSSYPTRYHQPEFYYL